MYKLLERKNRHLRQDVVELTEQLIGIPSPSLQEKDVADTVHATFSRLSYDWIHRDEAGNVLGIMDGRDSGPTLMLNAHMDTVRADEEQWEGSPLEPSVDQDRLVGLGAADCKSGLAAIMYAGELLKRCMLPLRGNLVVAATVAEENGRSIGVRHLMEKTLPELHLEPDCAVLAEPTDLRLFHGHDGWAELEIFVDGENPFHVRDAAQSIAEELESALAASDQQEPNEFAWMEGPVYEEDSEHRRARIRLDRRLHDTERVNEVIQSLRSEVETATHAPASVKMEVDVATARQKLYTGRTISVRNVTEAWETDPFNALVERSRQTLNTAGIDPRPGKWNLRQLRMGTAGSVLVNEFQVPTVGFGPGNEAEAHAANECVRIDRLHHAVYGLAAISHGLVGIPVFGWTSDEI